MQASRASKRRFSLIFFTLILLFAGIVARLFYWQVIQGNSIKIAASEQYEDHKKILARRGEILSSDNSPLVVNQPAFLLFAEPHHIENPRIVSQQLADILGKKKEDLEALLTEPNKKWVSLARSIDTATKQKVESLHLDGVGFESSTMRFYPEASMAAHLLGFVGLDDQGKQKGYFGIEGYYNRELSGKEGSQLQESDAKGNPILIGDATRVEPQDGRSLVLWLDRSIQFTAEKRLKEGMKKYGVESGSVVIMDPKSGGILAMASFPSYDPASYSAFDDTTYKNPIVSSSFEPGSTFKPLIVGAAINEKLMNATSMMNESGPVTIGEYTIKTWNEEYHGQISATQILQYSSNVGMVWVSRQLGKERELRYIQDFGLGEKTNIDLQEESSPEMRPPHSWTEIDYATASFGQGIAATPLQVVRAVGTIANGGWLMEPKVVKEIIDKQGKRLVIKEKKIKQIFSASTAREVKDMMVDAVKYGEAKWAKPKGYKVAGKTGTAQIPVAGHYDTDKTIASFVGFAPADDPRFVMLVTLQEPKSSPWGSETAAPLFFVIAKDLFAYLGISPTGD